MLTGLLSTPELTLPIRQCDCPFANDDVIQARSSPSEEVLGFVGSWSGGTCLPQCRRTDGHLNESEQITQPFAMREHSDCHALALRTNFGSFKIHDSTVPLFGRLEHPFAENYQLPDLPLWSLDEIEINFETTPLVKDSQEPPKGFHNQFMLYEDQCDTPESIEASTLENLHQAPFPSPQDDILVTASHAGCPNAFEFAGLDNDDLGVEDTFARLAASNLQSRRDSQKALCQFIDPEDITNWPTYEERLIEAFDNLDQWRLPIGSLTEEAVFGWFKQTDSRLNPAKILWGDDISEYDSCLRNTHAGPLPMTDSERGKIERKVWELMSILPIAVKKALDHTSAQPLDNLVLNVLNALLECFRNRKKMVTESDDEELPSFFVREWKDYDGRISAS